MQDSSNEIPRSDTSQPETPGYEPMQQGTPQQNIPQQGTPQQSTPQPGPTLYETPRQASRQIDRHRRPVGVTILSILIGLQGLGELLIGILAIAALSAIGRTLTTHGHTRVAAAFDIIGWILGILPLVVGVVTLLIAIGLFLLKRWAYWTTIVVSIIFLIRQVYELIKPRDTYTLVIIGTVIPVVILLYLLIAPDVRQAFGFGGRTALKLV